MQTSKLNEIMRQKDPELHKAFLHLANNETVQGIAMLAEQGRVTEIPDGQDRIAAIAKDYAAILKTRSSSPLTIGAASRSMKPSGLSCAGTVLLQRTAKYSERCRIVRI